MQPPARPPIPNAAVFGDRDRVALVGDGLRLTFGAVDDRVRRLAGWLLRQGIAPRDIVGITIRNELDHLTTAAALLAVNATRVILASHEPLAVRADLARRCRVAVVIADTAETPEGLPALRPDFDAIYAGEAAGRPLPPIDADAVTTIACSSGTTGRPKLAPLTVREFFVQLRYIAMPEAGGAYFGPGRVEFYNTERVLIRNLCLGHTSILAAQQPVVETCQRHGVTSLRMTTAAAQALVDARAGMPPPDLAPGFMLRVYGSPASSRLRADIARSLTPSVEVAYGTTEAGMIALAGPAVHAAQPDSVGPPMPEIELQLVDDEERAVAAGKTGRVRVRTPGMIHAYIDDPELTARTFRDGWFYPGDFARMTPEGWLVLGGRTDDVMNLSGIKVSAAEIEDVAASFPGVIECAAFPLASIHGDIPILAAAVEATVDLDRLQRYCRERLGSKAPRRIVKVDRLPRNAAGKVSRPELDALLARRQGA